MEQCGSSLLNDLNKEFSVNSGRVLIDYFYKLKLPIVFVKKGRGLKWARSVDFFMQILILDSVFLHNLWLTDREERLHKSFSL